LTNTFWQERPNKFAEIVMKEMVHNLSAIPNFTIFTTMWLAYYKIAAGMMQLKTHIVQSISLKNYISLHDSNF
jgi:hypothetical protein